MYRISLMNNVYCFNNWVIGQNVLVKIYIMLVLRAEYGAY